MSSHPLRPASGRFPATLALCALLVAAPFLSGVGCSRDPGPAYFTSQLTITINRNPTTLGNFAFSPNPANVAINAQVVWVNRDTVDRRIVATNGFFDSGPIKPGQSFQMIFRVAATYRYHDETPGSTAQGEINVIS